MPGAPRLARRVRRRLRLLVWRGGPRRRYGGHSVGVAKVLRRGQAAETELYDYTVLGTDGAAITTWWITSPPGNARFNETRMRFFVSGPPTAQHQPR